MPAKNPHHYALVVGINEYPLIKPLTKPVKDAEDFYAWLIDPNFGGLDPTHCEREYSVAPAPGPPLAEREKRRQARPKVIDIKEKLSDLMDAGNKLYTDDSQEWTSSRLYLFFAGHGMAKDFRDCDLFLADAGQQYYEQRAPCEYILNHLVNIRPSFKEIVFFADCCRSAKSDVSSAFVLEAKKWPSRGGIRFASCYATLFNDKSYETTKEDGRGFFSQALLEGLKGFAAPAGAEITTDNLRVYVQNRVKQLTTRAPGGPQTPHLDAPEAIVLLPVSPGPPSGSGPAASAVNVRFERFTGQVRLHGPDDQPVAGVAPFDAVPGAVWNLPVLSRVIHHVVALTGDPSLLNKGGYFSWKDVPEENGVSKPMEM